MGRTRRWGLAAIAFLAASCTPAPEPTETALPQVVATSTMLSDWTDRVGGDAIALTGILEPGADPHVYEPVPGDVRAIEDAELVLYAGYNLEPGLQRIIDAAADSARTVPVSEVVTPLDYEYDNQTVPDPHVWGDVEHAIAMVAKIRDELVAIAPAAEADIRANAEEYITELERLDEWIATQTATIPPEQRRLVTTHDAFQYYARAYDLEVVGTLIGISTEEKPSAKTVRELVEAVKAAGVPTLFAETTINPELIATVAREAGVELAEQKLYSDSVGPADSPAGSYIGMMVSNTEAIATGLGGTYEPFEQIE